MKGPIRLAAGIFAVTLVVTGAEVALGSSKLLSEAKKAGVAAKNCQYCHVSATPKKDTYKPEDLNDKGKLLVEDQKKRNLKKPDVKVLKESAGAADKK